MPGAMRPEWTWEPFSGNKPKLLLGLIAIFYDCAFMYQHFVMYPNAAPENAAITKAAMAKPLNDGRGLASGSLAEANQSPSYRTFRPAKPAELPTPEPPAPGLKAGASQTNKADEVEASETCLGCGADFAPFAANCRKCGLPREEVL